jgi:hypothetical protein
MVRSAGWVSRKLLPDNKRLPDQQETNGVKCAPQHSGAGYGFIGLNAGSAETAGFFGTRKGRASFSNERIG